MTRSYCDDQLVSELAVAAGFYRGQAEMMRRAIQRLADFRGEDALTAELQVMLANDMEAELKRMMALYAPKSEEVVQ